MKKKSTRILFPLLFTIILLSPLSSLAAFEAAYRGKIYPGVKVAHISLAKLTPSQAKKMLQEKVTAGPHLLTLKKGAQSWVINLDQLGLRYYPAVSAQKAYQVGRQDSFWQNLLNQYLAWRQGQQLPLDFAWDEEKMKEVLTQIAAQINQPAIPTSLKVEEEEIKVQLGQVGKEVVIEALLSQIGARAKQNNWEEALEIPVQTTSSLPNQEEINQTQQRARQLWGKTLILTSEKQSFVLEKEQLIDFLDFQGGWQEEKIQQWIASLEPSVNQEPRNALFKFHQGRVEEFVPSQVGLRLDQKQLLGLLLKNLSLLEKGQEKIVLELPLRKIPPEITTADSNKFAISGLVGKGESWFFHSIPSRIHNIKLASEKFDGVLIKPQQTFSFNQTLGEVSQKTGYKSAWVIRSGKTVLGDGGGVCQVSTTLFRAALNAGLPIVERRAHSYRVSYYEYNSPLGMDATVFAPSVDLKFKNDYPCHLLIQRKIDTQKHYLAFEIYGCPDQRKVILSKPKVWDVVPPPPPLYIDDPSLPAGKVKQIDFPAWGSKVSFVWKVVRDGQIIHQKTFFSHYRAWQAVYLRGVNH